MASPGQSSKGAEPRRWRRDTLAYAIAVQAAILAVTVLVVVVRPGARDEPAFTAAPTILLPQKELEHRVALSEFQQAAAAPLQLEKLVSSALLPPDLPSLPTVPRTDFQPLEDSAFLARDAGALLANSGLGGPLGGVRGTASAAAFFGVEDGGERIVVVVNTSVSVRHRAARRGVPWERIQEEVTRLVDGLGGGTLFAIVQFSQGVRTFPEFLAPATAANRAAARAWIAGNLAGNPPVRADDAWSGHEAAFEAAFRLDPDVVFLVTDGVLDRREVRGGRVAYPLIAYESLEASLEAFRRPASREVRVHVVGFELSPRDAANMRRLARTYGGRVREF